MFTPTEEHPTIAHYVWHEKLHFCGCGRPEDVLAKFRDALKAMKAVSDMHRSDANCYPMGKATSEMQALHDASDAACGSDDGARYLMYYALHAAGLTEHGGSVPGWPTNEGLEFLEFLEKTPLEDWMGDE